MDTIGLLITVAEHTGIYGEQEITTVNLSKHFAVSQQTISNELRRLEQQGLIKRKPRNTGIRVSFTNIGRNRLLQYKKRLIDLTKGAESLSGTVFTGVGEGKFYTEVKKYKQQFIKKLRINPHPGTLNLKVDQVEKQRFLSGKKPVMIDGFSTKKRAFGGIKSYIVRIKGVRCAITMPERTIHRNTIEIISNHNLRKNLKLKDDDRVTVAW